MPPFSIASNVMKIHTKILLFLAFASPVFDALAAVYVAYRNGNNFYLINDCAGVYVGTIYDSSSLACSVGKTFTSGSRSFTVTYFSASSTIQLNVSRDDGRTYTAKMFGQSSICPPPKEVNPQTGICEDAPAEDFCQSPEWDDIVFQRAEACAAQYPNHFTNVKPSCTDENNYSVKCEKGFPRPADPDDLEDPTDPITPPSGDFGGGSSGTANPEIPDFDKPEPDSPTPDSDTDKAVMEAIRNLNRDNNAALKGINTDVNKGFTDINNQLSELNGTNKALGQSVVDQMKQDYQIYQGHKQLMLQQTGTITGVTKAVNAQTGVLKSSVDGLGSNIDGLGEKLDGIQQAIGDSAPCDPNSDERSCEGSHGLKASTVGAISNQIDDSVNSSFDAVTTELTDTAQYLIDTPLTGQVEQQISGSIDDLLRVLPSPGSCSPFSIPSPFGGQVSFSCEFSFQFKALFSFLMYIFTAWTLIDILLTGITPRIQTTQNHSDYVT